MGDVWEMLDINVVVMCILISYGVGANNSSNSWSMAYSTQTLSVKTAVTKT